MHYTLGSYFEETIHYESTDIYKERDVYQYKQNSKPVEGHTLRMDNEVVSVAKILEESASEVAFLSTSGKRYVWRRYP